MHRRLLDLATAQPPSFSIVVAIDDVDDALVLADGLGYAMTEQDAHPRGVRLDFASQRPPPVDGVSASEN